MNVVCKGEGTTQGAHDGEASTRQVIDETNEWSSVSIPCAHGSAVCGIQTKLVPYTSFGDNVGIVDVRLICCLVIVG